MKKIGQLWQNNGNHFKAALLTLPMAVAVASFSNTANASLSDLIGIGNGDAAKISSQTAQNGKPVPVHEAFSVFPEQKGNILTLRFEVKDGYYLYQNKIKLDLPEGVTAAPLQFSLAPNTVNDPDFGQVPVFEKNFTATTTLSSKQPITQADSLVKWQGCAKAGLCYPPEKTAFTLSHFSIQTTGDKNKPTPPKPSNPAMTDQPTIKLASGTPAMPNTPTGSEVSPAVTLSAVSTNQTLALEKPNTDTTSNPAANHAAASTPLSQNPVFELEGKNSINDNDPFGLVAHPLWAMALLFLAGLGLAFTPCVLPMLPIVANIIARQHNPTAKKALLLTSGYGLGVATSYGILGVIIAVFGQSLGIMNWLQNPVILLGFALLFVLLGLYMLDRLPIRLPAKISQQLNKLTQVGENRLGSVTGSFITGFFSALVVSPCVSAPLAGALAGVATTGNPVTGFFALFMLGLGLSTPLILLGATQGNFMPKSGAWMNSVKTGFALLLFAVALLMIERVFVTSWMLGLWAVWFAVVAVWLWRLKDFGKNAGQFLTKALSLILAVWSACLVVGMASGATDSWQPLKPLLAKNVATLPQNSTHQTITTLAQLTPFIDSKQKILVDVTADWCIECRIMDKNLFTNPPATLQKWQVIRLDVTADTPESRTIYEQLKVFGPPVLLYFDNGKLVFRQNGEVKRDEFEQALAKLH